MGLSLIGQVSHNYLSFQLSLAGLESWRRLSQHHSDWEDKWSTSLWYGSKIKISSDIKPNLCRDWESPAALMFPPCTWGSLPQLLDFANSLRCSNWQTMDSANQDLETQSKQWFHEGKVLTKGCQFQHQDKLGSGKCWKQRKKPAGKRRGKGGYVGLLLVIKQTMALQHAWTEP